MCLAVPMKLSEVFPDGKTGKVEMGGVSRKVMLNLISDYRIGDFVLIHAGFAIEKLNEQEAIERLKLFKELEQIKMNESEKHHHES